MIPIASSWRTTFRSARIVAPDAPFPYIQGTGHQWFGIDGKELRPDRIRAVRLAFDDLVKDIIDRQGFADRMERVAIVGVSQGAIVALDAVASRRWQIGALVSIAGLLPPGPVMRSSGATRVLMLHGRADQTVPFAATLDASKRLASAGYEVETHILPGLGHTVSTEELELARDFLIKVFGA
jgi:phospholipase/carboxylesterase